MAMLSLKHSLGESALLSKMILSKGMSIRLAWTSPEHPVDRIQACLWRATLVPTALTNESVSSPQRFV